LRPITPMTSGGEGERKETVKIRLRGLVRVEVIQDWASGRVENVVVALAKFEFV
jgi:hypothetical protein